MLKTQDQMKDFSSYLHFLSESDSIFYIGPRAIFNPNFIPPKIIPQFKRTQMLYGIIQDAVNDSYATNVAVYGLKGAGKNLTLNVITKWFQSHNSCAGECGDSPIVLVVDCVNFELGQILFSILHEMCKNLGMSLDLDEILTWDSITSWNTFKYLLSKTKRPVILYLQKIEYVEEEIIDKIMNFAKSTKNLHILSSINTGNQYYSFNQYSQLDHRIKMGVIEREDLFNITEQRAQMAFQSYLEPTAIRLITDYIIEFGTKVPGSCVEILKRIYPIMEEQGEILPDDLRKIVQYHFEGIAIDGLGVADYVVKSSIEERLFLDYIINHFRNPSQFYINEEQIKRAYQMTAEELRFKVKSVEFTQRFANIQNAQILRPSHFTLEKGIEHHRDSKNSISAHYLSLPVDDVDQILDMSFGLIDNSPIE